MIYGMRDGIVIMRMEEDEAPELLQKDLPEGIIAVVGPDWVQVGWRYDGKDFIPEPMEGFVFDMVSHRYIDVIDYRRMLHHRTTDDTMEAMRKIREGNTDADWNAWLNALDEYNRAVSSTEGQSSPVWPPYPEYPVKK